MAGSTYMYTLGGLFRSYGAFYAMTKNDVISVILDWLPNLMDGLRSPSCSVASQWKLIEGRTETGYMEVHMP